jgi:hypothetical protein
MYVPLFDSFVITGIVRLDLLEDCISPVLLPAELLFNAKA